MRTVTLLALSAAAVAAASSTTPVFARSGGADMGDSYLNQEVQNPRYVEPGGYADPSRYRISNPWAGYEDRQLAARGIYSEGSGYYPPRSRGRVLVQPYYTR